MASQRRPFKGAMDELKIYNSTLSSEEIKAQYEYNMNPFTLTAENGKLVLDFEKDFTEEPVIEDFAVTMHKDVYKRQIQSLLRYVGGIDRCV